MRRLKIIADNTVPYLCGIAESIADMVYLPSTDFTPEAVKEADALIVRSIDRCSRELLSGSRVQLITTATIGFDHIDTTFCQEAGITWKNAPGCNASSVAQYVLASLVTIALRKGESLRSKTIGIVGVGHVGKEIEKLCTAWGMTVLRNDPPRAAAEGDTGFVSLETIAQQADIITLHVPYTTQGAHATHHLADAAWMKQLQKRPWFINSCRGPVHDTKALLEARRSGQISELIIDCWENEPDVNRQLLGMASIATPHIAGFSADGKANGTRQCLENIATHFQVEIEKLPDVIPPAPNQPVIDLTTFDTHRIEQTLLTSFNPLHIDQALRQSPEQFEWLRAHYNHPREYKAYTPTQATKEEQELLVELGFRSASQNVYTPE